MKGRTVTRAGLAWGAFALFLLVLFASPFFRTPMTDAERASLAARYADHAYSDARLRELAETADPDTEVVLKAELARRARK